MSDREPVYDPEIEQATGQAMAMLRAGVPLTLLADLVLGSNSHEVLVREGGQADWIHRGVA